jgi:cyanophycinase
MRAFLIGGGRGDDTTASHRPFVEALAGAGPVVVYLLDDPEAEPARWSAALAAAGAATCTVITVSKTRPPLPTDLDGAAGVYVAGGLTPAYRDALVDNGTDWLAAAGAAGLPYAGFSAGASVAAEHALVGGWRANHGGTEIAVCDQDFGEDLDALTVRPGLGLVPFLVDVHAAQWGTLNRLVHAVLGRTGRTGRTDPADPADPADPGEGWAIDEHTTLETADGVPVVVHGTGAATHVKWTKAQSVEMTIHVAGPVHR